MSWDEQRRYRIDIAGHFRSIIEYRTSRDERRESDESRLNLLRNGDGQPIEVEVRTESRHQLTLASDFTPLCPPIATGDLSSVTLPPLLRHYETFLSFSLPQNFRFADPRWSQLTQERRQAHGAPQRWCLCANLNLRQHSQVARTPN